MPRDRLGATGPSRFTTAVDAPLVGAIDIDEVVRQARPEQQVKGMLFGDALAVLGPRFDAIAPTLEAPPRLGRYVPFVDYPPQDYARLVHAAAIHKFPRVSSREAVRVFGRSSVDLFAQSQLGAVMMSFADSPGALLARYASIYMSLVKATPVSGESSGPRSFRLTFTGFIGLPDYVLGSIEGCVMHFSGSPRLEVLVEARGMRVETTW